MDCGLIPISGNQEFINLSSPEYNLRSIFRTIAEIQLSLVTTPISFLLAPLITWSAISFLAENPST